MTITRFEYGLLCQMAALYDGGFGPKTWGAAVDEATEYLFSKGYLRRVITADREDYELTEKGIEAAHTRWQDFINQVRKDSSTPEEEPL